MNSNDPGEIAHLIAELREEHRDLDDAFVRRPQRGSAAAAQNEKTQVETERLDCLPGIKAYSGS
jgi:hypothetical protein